MTEEEWLEGSDASSMLDWLPPTTSNRKLLLFEAACCRRIWQLLSYEQSQKAVEATENYADKQAGLESLRAAKDGAEWVAERTWYGFMTGSYDAAAAALYLTGKYTDPSLDEYTVDASHSIREKNLDTQNHHVDLLRDILGNPFRCPKMDPAWHTPKVVTLSQAVYTERAFDRMPELAIALEEAGCANKDILDHCRGPGPHVRGCWVVDLILGKE